MVIAIDGYAASGKSSLARAISKEIGFKYIDTGQIFRAVTYAVINNMQIDVKIEDSRIFIGNMDITENINSREVTENVSKIGSIEEHRDYVYKIQRDFSKSHNIVISGRDSGTRIFPGAEVKFFVIADLRVRAERRAQDLNISVENMMDSLSKRDKRDIELGNLVKSESAFVIDNSSDSFNSTVEEMLKIIKSYI